MWVFPPALWKSFYLHKGGTMDKINHTTPIETIITQFDSHVDLGLTKEKAEANRERFGVNKLQETKRKSILKRFIEQISDFMIIVLLAAALISFLASPKEGWIESLL